MKSTVCIASIGWLAAALANPALAGESESAQARDHHRAWVEGRPAVRAVERGMQAVPHDASPDEAAYGWQYFSDPGARRAVVISPRGDYYYSRGKGLRRVVAPRTSL